MKESNLLFPPDFCSERLLGSWSAWGKCEGTCENPFKRRVRTNLFPSVLLFCDKDLLFEDKPCRQKGCRGEIQHHYKK